MKSRFYLLIGASAFLMACGSENSSSTATTETSTATTTETTAPATPTAPAPAAFDKTVSYEKINITISSANTSDDNSFTVTTTGLSASNMTGEKFSIKGAVTDVLIDDLDGDNSPEFFVIGRSAAGGLASVQVFSTFNQKSCGMVNFPDQSANPDVTSAFKEGDEYMPVEGIFVMRFPLYENGTKTEKTRQLQFKLKPGEAMKQLVFSKKIEY